MFNRIATVTNPGDSVMLPPAQPGCDIMVLNVGGNQMTVYGLQTLSNGSITASTTHTQAGATPITTMQAAVTVNNASDAVVLPPSAPGLQIDIANLSATLAAQIYASGTDTINGTAGSTGIALTANQVTLFFCFQAGKWLTR